MKWSYSSLLCLFCSLRVFGGGIFRDLVGPKTTMDVLTWRASAGVRSHRRAKRTINILKLAVMQSVIGFYTMADFIWSLMPSGDDYKVVSVNDEGTYSAIKPRMAAPPACARVRELYMQMTNVFVQLQSSMSESPFVLWINAALSAFPHTDNRLFSFCHFHLRSPIKLLPAFRMLMSTSWLQVSPWIPDRRYFQ